MKMKNLKQKVANLQAALKRGIILSLKTHKAENTAIMKITIEKSEGLTASNPPYTENWAIDENQINQWYKELNL